MIPELSPAISGLGSRFLAAVRRRWVALALGAILLLGCSARLLESRRGLPYLHHWDEPFIANRSLQILRSGDFNPHFFSYGSLIIYVHAAVDALHYLTLARLPDRDPEALREPATIRFHGAREDPLDTAPEREPYWISHPSFYLWNRRMTALFGTLAVALTFFLTRRLAHPEGPRAAGTAGAIGALAAAFVLATCGFHIEHSAWVTTDVPASTLALATLLGTLAFVDGKGPRPLLVAAVALGLAVSTKYNSAVFGLVPAGALTVAAVRRSPGYRHWLWAAVPACVGVAFLALTPYALLDLPTFLRDTGRMLYSYLGNENQLLPVEPGWPHLRLDLGLLADNLGWVVALGALGGLALALRSARAWAVLPIGLLVLWATSSARTPFHRNVVICYPLAAVAFGLAVAWALREGPGLRPRRALALVLLLGSVPSAMRGLADARRVGGTPETRSQLVDRLNEAARHGLGSVAFASELNIHPFDLARLELPYAVRPLRDLLCAPGDEEVVALPARPWANFDLTRPELERIEALRLGAGAVVLQVAPENLFTLDSPLADPGLEVRRAWATGALTLGCAHGGIPFDSLSLEGETGRNPRSLGLAPGASARTAAYSFPAGKAIVAVEIASALRETASRIDIVVRQVVAGGPSRELARWPLAPGRRQEVAERTLALADPAPLTLNLEVPSDSPAGVLLYGIWIDSAPPGAVPDP